MVQLGDRRRWILGAGLFARHLLRHLVRAEHVHLDLKLPSAGSRPPPPRDMKS